MNTLFSRLESDRLLAFILTLFLCLAPIWGRQPLFLAGFALLSAIGLFFRPVTGRFQRGFALWSLGMGATILYSIHRFHTLGSLALLFTAFLAFLLASGLRREALAEGLLLAALLVEVWALFLFVQDALHLARPQWVGPFFRTNDLAGFLILLIPLALSHRSKWGMFIASLGISEWIATQSRAGWISGAVALLVWLFLAWRGGQKVWKAWPVLAGALVLVLCFNHGANLSGRLASLAPAHLNRPTENSLLWRKNLLQNAGRLALEHPLLGTGYGTFSDALPRYQDRAGYFAHDAHNHYVQLWGEAGLLGLAFLLLLAWLFRQGFSQAEEPLVPGFLSGLAGSSVHAFFDIDWSVPGLFLLFWVMAGGIVQKAKNEEGRYYLPFALLPLYFCLVASLMNVHADWGDRLFPWSGKAKATLAVQRHSAPLAAEAVRLEPWNGNHYALLGRLSREPAASRAAFRTAIRLNPFLNPGFYRELADRLPPQEALPVLRQALERFPLSTLSSYEAYSPAVRPALLGIALSLQERQCRLGKGEEARKLQPVVDSLFDDVYAPYFAPELAAPWKSLALFWTAIGQKDSAKLAEVLTPLPSSEALRALCQTPVPEGMLEVLDLKTEGNEVLLDYRLGNRRFQNLLISQADGWRLRFP